MKKIVLLLTVVGILTSCGKKDELNLVKTDLLQYGVPITIKAPKTATFESSDLAGLRGVVITDSMSYFQLSAYANPITTSDVTQYKAEKLGTERARETFTKLIQEDRDGFIYESKWDEQTTGFQFVYFVVAGDKYYTLENIGNSILTLEEAKRIYNAIRAK